MKLNPRTLFRTVAVAEAVSWAGLLVAMYVKYGPAKDPSFVRIFGSVHGAVFIAFVLTVLFVRTRFRWNFTTFMLAGLSSIPPFCTLLFEVMAERRGLLKVQAATRTEADQDSALVAASS